MLIQIDITDWNMSSKKSQNNTVESGCLPDFHFRHQGKKGSYCVIPKAHKVSNHSIIFQSYLLSV